MSTAPSQAGACPPAGSHTDVRRAEVSRTGPPGAALIAAACGRARAALARVALAGAVTLAAVGLAAGVAAAASADAPRMPRGKPSAKAASKKPKTPKTTKAPKASEASKTRKSGADRRAGERASRRSAPRAGRRGDAPAHGSARTAAARGKGRRPAARAVAAAHRPTPRPAHGPMRLDAGRVDGIRIPAFSVALPAVAPSATPSAFTARSAAPAAAVDLDTLAGRSGKLRARFVVPASGMFSYLRRLFGDSVEAGPGVYTAVAETRRPFTYIAMLPFAEKVDGRIGRYRIGFWPGERRAAGRAGGKYGTPAGFIQVTPDNAETAVSEHFRLRDFLTHDQARVWPKYLVLDAALVDKLELVITELRARGYRADRLHVMSGFRTPQYNRSGGDASGRAELSRHQYGDAADVWVENGDGTMADLDGDGRVDARDAAILAAAAERVERAHPELTGGVGVYHATRAHGPFVHIDTRGHRARWGAG